MEICAGDFAREIAATSALVNLFERSFTMKVSRRSLIVIVALAALLGLVTDESRSGTANWPALSKVDALQKTLQDAGFSLQPGRFTYWDLVEATCRGVVPQ